MILLLKILKSKWTYILLSIILLFSNIFFIQQIIKIKKDKANTNRIIELNIENELLKKELAGINNKKVLENSFTNSKIEIEKIEARELNINDKKVIDIINNEFDIFMQDSSNKY